MSAAAQSSVANGSRTRGDTAIKSKHQHSLYSQAFESAATRIKILLTKNFDVAVLCVVIVMIWVLLALPTIFYHMPTVSTSNTSCLYILCQ